MNMLLKYLTNFMLKLMRGSGNAEYLHELMKTGSRIKSGITLEFVTQE
jgi:hypothetical protein